MVVEVVVEVVVGLGVVVVVVVVVVVEVVVVVVVVVVVDVVVVVGTGGTSKFTSMFKSTKLLKFSGESRLSSIEIMSVCKPFILKSIFLLVDTTPLIESTLKWS